MFVAAFTDPQGTTYTAAHFEVSTANLSRSTNEYFDNKISIGEEDNTTTTNSNLTYQMYYWVDTAAKEAGRLPYLLANSSPMGDTFYISDLDASYDGMLAVAAAEHHCQTVTLA
jgi:hypothetical protein